MYRVEFKPSAVRQLEELDRGTRARVDRKIDELAKIGHRRDVYR